MLSDFILCYCIFVRFRFVIVFCVIFTVLCVVRFRFVFSEFALHFLNFVDFFFFLSAHLLFHGVCFFCVARFCSVLSESTFFFARQFK